VFQQMNPDSSSHSASFWITARTSQGGSIMAIGEVSAVYESLMCFSMCRTSCRVLSSLWAGFCLLTDAVRTNARLTT